MKYESDIESKSESEGESECSSYESLDSLDRSMKIMSTDDLELELNKKRNINGFSKTFETIDNKIEKY